MLSNVHIPYGGYWSSPFARWQKSLAHLHSLRFAADTAKKELDRRGIGPDQFDHAVLGSTIPQEGGFHGLPWFTSLIGADHVGGTQVAQACATGVRCLASAAHEIELGSATTSLAVACDRTSNAPVMTYPDPTAQGGAPAIENWVLDNFAGAPLVPFGDVAMVATAENCAREWQIDTAQQHDVVLRRYAQYDDALADDRAFQKRYMTLPFAVPDRNFAKVATMLDGDEGIYPTSREKLDTLRPATPGGSVTYGGQTHPADGHAAAILATPERARALSRDPGITIAVLGFGQARARRYFMPHAPVPAAARALEAAGVELAQIDAVKTHNPFAVNDIVFAKETGFDIARMNNFGCSLVWGHPNGPTGLRSVVELIEELVARGGGLGLFTGCAAGDLGLAVVLRVDDTRGP